MKDIDYYEIYVDVIKSMIWKFLLALTAKYDWEIEQIDVVIVILKKSLHEKIWIKQSHELVKEREYVCRLNKILYDLKLLKFQSHQ